MKYQNPFSYFFAVAISLTCGLAFAADPAATSAPSPFAAQVLSHESPGTERADTYDDALARAKVAGKDIVVLQYGSDWNPCSESLYQNVWSKADIVKALGDGFVLVAIDYPEVLGGRAVYGRCTAEKCGLIGFSDTPIGSQPPMRLENQSGANGTPPSCELTNVSSEAGVVFAQRPDGAFLAKSTLNPAQDTLMLKLKPSHTGRLLRLDFPLDDSLGSGGPGRSGNGNAVISEVEVLQGKTPIKTEFAWGSTNVGNNFGPWTAVDGVTNKADEGWNLNGGQHQPRTLFVSLKQSVVADTEVTVNLVCKSQWAQHVPGCVRAAIVADEQTLADVRAVAQAQATQYRNRQFNWAGWGKIPRIAMLDAQGRAIAADEQPRLGLTPQSLATTIKAWRAQRERRDALWAKAEKAQGAAKAELLRQSLDLLDVGRDPAFGRNNGWGGAASGGHYEFVHQAMKAADPKDESGAVRWLGFSMGAWGGLPWAPANEWWKKLDGKPNPTDADYAAAEACIDRELADPRNKLLEHDHIQHIMKARYDLYLRQFKGDHTHPKVLEVQRQIAASDPTTFWGVGAIGYVGMFRRSDSPFLCYGWDGNHQLKAGANSWSLADAPMQLDHAGPYKFTMNFQSGKDAFKVTRIAVLDGGREIAAGKPAAGQETVGPDHRSVTATFDCREFTAGRPYTLRIDYEAQAGHFDTIGGFEIEPLLVDE